MELRQLHYLAAVVDDASFTHAAARLHLTQPGVSSQIRALERELGQRLLDRTVHGVRLTDVGAAVLPHARAALRAADHIRDTVAEHAGLLRGQVSVGIVASSTLGFDMIDALAGFHRRHPQVALNLTEGRSDDLEHAVAAGDLDTAVIAPGPRRPAGIEQLLLADVAMVAAVHREHPLADRASIPLTELQQHRLISFDDSVGTSAHLLQSCAQAGFVPTIAFKASDPVALARLAAAGLGVAVLPAPYADPDTSPLHAIALTPELRGRLALAWRTEGPSNPAARAFIEHLHEQRVVA